MQPQFIATQISLQQGLDRKAHFQFKSIHVFQFPICFAEGLGRYRHFRQHSSVHADLNAALSSRNSVSHSCDAARRSQSTGLPSPCITAAEQAAGAMPPGAAFINFQVMIAHLYLYINYLCKVAGRMNYYSPSALSANSSIRYIGVSSCSLKSSLPVQSSLPSSPGAPACHWAAETP